MAKDTKSSGLEPELLGRQGGRARDEKPASQSPADKLKADLEAQRRKASDMAAKAAAEAKPRTYVVEAGDSLSVIAKKVYGDASRWKEIFEANKATLKDPNLIRVGQELVIPE
jgi:nucleoid-associated protein YgaU